MPLDGHSYLVSQGWGGKGTGLRPGAISRAIAIPKKKNLAGVGKDRDEAFPFWDHLFTAASKSIQIKCGSGSSSDDEEGNGSDDNSNSGAGHRSSLNPKSHEPTGSNIKRTATGIPSTRRPIQMSSASSSGDTTPESDEAIASSMFRLTLLAQAKRAAARKGLYARFYRGEVLAAEMREAAPLSSSSASPAVATAAAAAAVAAAPMKMMAILDSSKAQNDGQQGRESSRDTEDGESREEEEAKKTKEEEGKRKRKEERRVAKEQRRKAREEKRQRKAEKKQRKQELEASSSHAPIPGNGSTIPELSYPSTSTSGVVQDGDDTTRVVGLVVGTIPQPLHNEEASRAERKRKKEVKQKKREAELDAIHAADEDNNPREVRSKKRKRKVAAENKDGFGQEITDDNDEQEGRRATEASASEKSKDKKSSKKRHRQQEHTASTGQDDSAQVATLLPAKKKKKKDAA